MRIHSFPLRWLCIVCFVALSGCGFQLRGSTNIPFKTIYLGVNDTSPIAVELKRSIRGNGPTKVVADAALADIRLYILGESLTSDILTINSLGLATEYNLHYSIHFRVSDAHGHDYIPPTELVLKRLVLANNNAVLAQNNEIAQLYADMQSDAAQQILRRIEAIKPAPTAP